MRDQNNIGQIIHDRRRELGFTLEYVGNAVGVSKSTVKKWESGFINNMGRDKIAALSKVLDLNPIILVTGKLQAPEISDDIVVMPVIGDIAAGYNQICAEDWSGETVEIPRSYLKGRAREEFLVLRVKGDSMYPLYHDGDRVLILKQDTIPEFSEICAVLYDDENATLKKVESSKNKIRLVPVNPMYQPEEISGEALAHFRVLGLPVYLIREIKQ